MMMSCNQAAISGNQRQVPEDDELLCLGRRQRAEQRGLRRLRPLVKDDHRKRNVLGEKLMGSDAAYDAEWQRARQLAVTKLSSCRYALS